VFYGIGIPGTLTPNHAQQRPENGQKERMVEQMRNSNAISRQN
jgi:hypothetical protein